MNTLITVLGMIAFSTGISSIFIFIHHHTEASRGCYSGPVHRCWTGTSPDRNQERHDRPEDLVRIQFELAHAIIPMITIFRVISTPGRRAFLS